MVFRTDDPTVNIDTQAPAAKPKPKESSTMKNDAQQRAQAQIDIDRLKAAERPKNSRDARLDAIEKAKRGDNAGTGAKEARAKMINRIQEQAQ